MKNKKLYLNNRRILRISGPTSIDFLNSILTSDMFKLKPNKIMPSALLTPQGRILFDLLLSIEQINKTNDFKSIFIECDVSQVDDLFSRINMYNLRKEVNIEKTKHKVFVIDNIKNSLARLEDKRFVNLSLGRIYDDDILEEDLPKYDCHENLNWYEFYRYKHCIAEGPKEIISGTSLPLEINLDLLEGISFDKGCFIGQEVNARIKWKGLVKKKYVPIELTNYDKSIKKINLNDEKEIYLFDDQIGEVIELKYHKETNNYYGIAIIKLSYLYEFEKNQSLLCDFKKTKMKINFPDYLLPLPKKL
ncbi:hypothetical protein N8Z28_00145 [bacterium]|nr:hypothetical protein [bacterium]